MRRGVKISEIAENVIICVCELHGVVGMKHWYEKDLEGLF